MSESNHDYIPVDPAIRAEAEVLLHQMGLPMDHAVDMFLRQVIIQRRLPIETTIPRGNPVSVEGMTKEELGALLSKSIQQVANGEVVPHEEVVARYRMRHDREAAR